MDTKTTSPRHSYRMLSLALTAGIGVWLTAIAMDIASTGGPETKREDRQPARHTLI